MAVFTMGLGFNWHEWLELHSFTQDINKTVKKAGKQIQYTISEETRNLIASNESLLLNFQEGFDKINGTFSEGFGLIGSQLDNISQGIESLGAAFSFGFSLLAQQLETQTHVLSNILERLDGIHETLESPTLTQAREFFNIGRERLRKGLLDKALESFLKAVEINDTDFLTEYSLAHVYLYGKNEDCDVIDFTKAEKHFHNAARFAKSEIAELPEARRFCGEAYFHLSLLYYILANEKHLEGDISGMKPLLKKSVQFAKRATEIYPRLTESFYQHAKSSALLTNAEATISSLEIAIKVDRNYCLKADIDKDFDSVRSSVFELFEKFRRHAEQDAKKAIERFPNLDNYVPLKEESEQSFQEIESHLNEAKSSFQRATYFDYLDVIDISRKALNILLDDSQIITKAQFEAQTKITKMIKNRIETERTLQEMRSQEEVHKQKVLNAWSKVPIAFIVAPLLLGILGWFIIGLVGCFTRATSGYEGVYAPLKAFVKEGAWGLLLGIAIGIISGIATIRKELK